MRNYSRMLPAGSLPPPLRALERARIEKVVFDEKEETASAERFAGTNLGENIIFYAFCILMMPFHLRSSIVAQNDC